MKKTTPCILVILGFLASFALNAGNDSIPQVSTLDETMQANLAAGVNN